MSARLGEHDLPAIHGGQPLFTQRFRFIRPTLPALDSVLGTYRSAYENGLITNADVVGKFEAAVAERLQVKHCVAVSSCTSGLMMSLRGLGVTGEVIIPSFTFFATGHSARWNGLTPVFADCDPDTWNVDVADVERKITERTKALLIVHLYGNPANVETLTKIAERHNLKLIFDGAHAFGSQYRGKPIGSFGNAEVFSLSPTKLLVAGEGGLVTTNDASLAKAIRLMRNYGDGGAYDPEWIGMNARMSEFNAALGLAGLPEVDERVRRRNQIARMYDEHLAGLPGLRFQKVDHRDVNTFKDYSIHVTPEQFGMTRDELAEGLLAENIETKKYFYPPMHMQTLYQQFHKANGRDLKMTEQVTGGILSLPIYELLPDSTIEKVSLAVRRLANHAGSRKEVSLSGRQ
ncbi:MAG: DegT/DnrJ/EryC1/StrS family aminotransferase [Candidatus Acidiferrum sp.]